MQEKFDWTAEYSIQNHHIDQEHQHLFMLANRMLQLKREGENLAKIRDAIAATYDYVKTHFRSEEEYMKSIEYPLLHEQQALHGEIIRDMNEIMQQSANIDALVYKFKRLLYGWVTNHILLEDKKIGLFCRNKERKKALEQPEAVDTAAGQKESAPVKENKQNHPPPGKDSL